MILGMMRLEMFSMGSQNDATAAFVCFHRMNIWVKHVSLSNPLKGFEALAEGRSEVGPNLTWYHAAGRSSGGIYVRTLCEFVQQCVITQNGGLAARSAAPMVRARSICQVWRPKKSENLACVGFTTPGGTCKLV